jgi:hypothetical protein
LAYKSRKRRAKNVEELSSRVSTRVILLLTHSV